MSEQPLRGALQPNRYSPTKTSKHLLTCTTPTCIIHPAYHLCCVARSNHIELISTETGEVLGKGRDLQHGIDLVTFTAGNQLLYSNAVSSHGGGTKQGMGSNDYHRETSVVMYYSFHDNRILTKFTGHFGKVTSLAMMPLKAGSHIYENTGSQATAPDTFVTGSNDGYIVLWDLRTGGAVHSTQTEQTQFGLFSFKTPVVAVQFDPSGNSLATVTQDQLTVFDVRKLDAATPVSVFPTLKQDTTKLSQKDKPVLHYKRLRMQFQANHRLLIYSLGSSLLAEANLTYEQLSVTDLQASHNITSILGLSPDGKYLCTSDRTAAHVLNVSRLDWKDCSAAGELDLSKLSLDNAVPWRGHKEQVVSCSWDTKTDLVISSSIKEDIFWTQAA